MENSRPSLGNDVALKQSGFVYGFVDLKHSAERYKKAVGLKMAPFSSKNTFIYFFCLLGGKHKVICWILGLLGKGIILVKCMNLSCNDLDLAAMLINM